ncbi:MAG: HAD hydrolase-like protein [Pseudomonadota bacterium]
MGTTNTGYEDGVAQVPDLLSLSDRFDAMLLDGFGVLNCGGDAVPGMQDTWAELRRRGVQLLILSNGSTGQISDAVGKYRAFGYPVDEDDVLTSRDATRVALRHHAREHPNWRWGVSPMGGRSLDDLDGQFVELDPDSSWEDVDGILLMTTVSWTHALTEALYTKVVDRPRPIWVANPDVTAPFPTHFSLEPGYLARRLAQLADIEVHWFGKPHVEVYDLAFERLYATNPKLSKDRILMVGDSPHTDVLGARRAGIASCMTVDFGLLRGQDLRARTREAGIWPDFVCVSGRW